MSPPDDGPRPDVPPDGSDARRAADSAATSGAKWFVIAFLAVVVPLGFMIVGAVAYALWRELM